MTGPTNIIQKTLIRVPLDSNRGRFHNESRPSVYNTNLLTLSSSGAQSIEYLLGGAEGQEVKILPLNAGITLEYNFGANDGKIITNTGIDKLLVINKVYTFTYYDGAWYENE